MTIFTIEACPTLGEFNTISRRILLQVADNRKLLRELVLAIPGNAKLFSMCAHYAAVDKIVLWNSEDQKMQLRLHVYSSRSNRSLVSPQVNIAEAHNHRWNFSSMILSGGYRHTIFKDDSSRKYLIPAMIRYEVVGDCYTLHHSQYHSIDEEPNTISLIMRGPLEKERFQVVREEDGRLIWQDASSLESDEERKQKTMSKERYHSLVDKLTNLKIISASPYT